MCGIAGFLSTGAARQGDEALRAMGNALAHRGPDASGTFLSPDGRVGLSHRRLSILDLTPTVLAYLGLPAPYLPTAPEIEPDEKETV